MDLVSLQHRTPTFGGQQTQLKEQRRKGIVMEVKKPSATLRMSWMLLFRVGRRYLSCRMSWLWGVVVTQIISVEESNSPNSCTSQMFFFFFNYFVRWLIATNTNVTVFAPHCWPLIHQTGHLYSRNEKSVPLTLLNVQVTRSNFLKILNIC